MTSDLLSAEVALLRMVYKSPKRLPNAHAAWKQRMRPRVPEGAALLVQDIDRAFSDASTRSAIDRRLILQAADRLVIWLEGYEAGRRVLPHDDLCDDNVCEEAP